MTTANARQPIVDTLDRFVSRCRERSVEIAEDFADNALLLGSEAGEVARGRDEVRTHFAAVFAQPFVIDFAFDAVEVNASGDIGWLYAEGAAHLLQAGGTRRLPYRLTGVLVRTDFGWRWTLFHGSEPAQG